MHKIKVHFGLETINYNKVDPVI